MSKSPSERRRVLFSFNLNNTRSKTPELPVETSYRTSHSFMESQDKSSDTHSPFKLDSSRYHTSRASALTRASMPKLSIGRKLPDDLVKSLNSHNTILDQIIVKASKIQQGLEKDRQRASRFLKVNAESQKISKLKNLSPISHGWHKVTYHQSKQDGIYPTTPGVISKTPPPRAKFAKAPLSIRNLSPDMLPQAKTRSETLESLKKLVAGFNQISRIRKG